ncbi:SoxR reducing system RseC family protein [Marinicella rhabdoformis]|uniref:SoxR reducing system RseC family protein n=1 Tax=Marinicella rhabdoformis TaxID=2580566 RepID=UPI0012AEDC8E|nr:SoxR reducing system RseC family protein [Marinicella rhabdoformis]
MIRLATITAKTEEAVQLKVDKPNSCDGCQLHCDKPLFDVFKLHKDQFWLKKDNNGVCITNPELIFSNERAVGQKVGLELSEGNLLKSAFVVYILPMLLALITMVLGQALFTHNMLSGDLGALLGFVIGLVLFYWLMHFKKPHKDMPKVTFI